MFLNRMSGQSSQPPTSSSATTATTTSSSTHSSFTCSPSTRRRSSFNRKSLRLPDILRDTEMVSHLRGLCTPPPSPLYQFSFFNRSSSTLTPPPISVNNTEAPNNSINNNNNNQQAFAFDTTQRRSTSSTSSTSGQSYRIPIEMELIRDVGQSLRRISNAFDEQRNHKALFTIIVILKFTMYFCIDCTNFGVSLWTFNNISRFSRFFDLH